MLAYVGSEEYCWSFVPSGSGSVRLGYSGSYVCFNATYRAFGFAVRCVQEFARHLFRDGFLPVCGASRQQCGSTDRRRFQWIRLGIFVFGLVFVLLVCLLVRRIYRCYEPCARLCVALCPRIYGLFGSTSRLRGIVLMRRECRQMSAPGGIFGHCRLQVRIRASCTSIRPTCASVRQPVLTVLRCVVSKRLQNSVLGMVSSRLRGSGAIRQECCQASVPTVMPGHRRLRIRMPGLLSFMVLIRFSGRFSVRSVLRCVVSKHLHVLLRNGLLPVCGVVPPGVGSVCECRFQRIFLVVVRFNAVFLVVGVPGGVRLRARE